MRSILAAALALGAVLLAAPGAASAASKPCAGGHTVMSNEFVRVYGADDDFFACSYENGKTMALGYVASSSTGFFDLDNFVLAGRYFAYRRVECFGMGGGECEVDDLILINMGRLRVVMRRHFGEGESLVSAVLKPNGSIAYLQTRARPDGPEYILRRRDRRGRAVLAVGMNEDAPSGLKLRGSTLRWKQGGVARTKTLR